MATHAFKALDLALSDLRCVVSAHPVRATVLREPVSVCMRTGVREPPSEAVFRSILRTRRASLVDAFIVSALNVLEIAICPTCFVISKSLRAGTDVSCLNECNRLDTIGSHFCQGTCEDTEC